MNFESDPELFKVLEQARAWAFDASESGWLGAKDLEIFASIQIQSPSTLFRDTRQRPLVVAFFGGTGVGKSTLLNRLAEQEIARTGVLRPTSREISLYLYKEMELGRLPKDFPVEKIQIARHESEAFKDVVWIDMPDIDSTERSNRQMVLDWLPHLDILIYVVSPERYRDEQGWRLLLSEGEKHAWLFVMNQFDLGEFGQVKAFESQLREAGFEDPIVLATDCSGTESTDQDDFSRLQNTITKLANRHTIEQLEMRALAYHFHEIEKAIDRCLEKINDSSANEALLSEWEDLWRQTVNDLEEGLSWPIQEAAQSLARTDGGRKLVKRLAREAKHDAGQSEKPSTNPVLWDDWAQSLLDDALDQVAVTAAAHGMPVAAFKNAFMEIRSKARQILNGQTEKSLRFSLANPGNAMQRFLLGLTRFCSVVLPLGAIAWVSYEVLDEFHQSSTSGTPYLGVDFAVHGALLIALSWLLPWFIHKTLKPSIGDIALKALKQGARNGHESIKARIDDAIGMLLERRKRLIEDAKAIQRECRKASASTPRPESTLLSRMLAKQSRIAET